MVVDEEYDNISIEDLVEELPPNSPRYVVLSYELKHDDGRTSFPLVFVNWAPSSCETTMMTLHASALLDFQRVVEPNKTIEVRDADEGLTEEIVNARLLST